MRLVAASKSTRLDFSVDVSVVFTYAEKGKVVAFIERAANLFEVLHQFQGNPGLTAVLVTDTGRDTQKPLGIITVWDLPQVQGAVDSQRRLGMM